MSIVDAPADLLARTGEARRASDRADVLRETKTRAGTARLAPLHQPAAPLRNKIIAALRGAIETGLLKPGQRLVEKDLCAQLDVSRTSLREALRELQAQGILEEARARGLSVARITRGDAENCYRLRAVIEALVVEQFIERATDAEILALRKMSETLKTAYRRGEVGRILTGKRAFYERICAVAQNPIAFDMINSLVLRTSSLRMLSLARPERQRQSVQEITALVQAMEDRDIAAARRAATAHVENAARFSLNHPDTAR